MPGMRGRNWGRGLAPAWGAFAGGCHPNRDTRAAIEAAGFSFDWIVAKVEARSPIAIVRPGIMGAAVKASA